MEPTTETALRLLWNLVRLLALGYAVLVAVVYLTQARLLYLPNLPSREVAATPAAVGLPFERVTLRTTDEIELDAWYIPAESARGALLFCHGNAGNIGHRLDSLEVFHRLGLAVLIFDYRGYGRSGGTPSEAGTYRDAEAAWRHLVEARGFAPERVVLFGRSLGGAVAAELTTRHRPGVLILESTFTSVPDMAAAAYPFLPGRWLSRFRYNAREAVGRAPAPVLVIHSPEDEIVPYRHGRALYDAARNPKAFLEIHGGHNEGFLESGERYREGIARFLRQYL